MMRASTTALVVLLVWAAGAPPRPVEAAKTPPTQTVAATGSTTPATGLSSALDAVFDNPVLARALVGVRIERLADPRTGATAAILYQRDSGKLVMPASNMKLVTLAVAADRLGWDFRYDTRLDVAGAVASGTLHGDLIVVGGGDPSIVSQDFSGAALFGEWADALVAAGIHHVDGRLIGDDRLFDDQGLGTGWAWDYLSAGYAAPSGALSYNENTVVIRVFPGASSGQFPRVEVSPPGHPFIIHATVTTGPPDSAVRVTVSRPPGSRDLTIGGSVPAAGAVVVRDAAVDEPARFFLGGYRAALASRGISIAGADCSMRDLSDAPPDSSRRTIATRESMPLSALAGYFIKVSQNFYAEMLLKTIARAGGRPGTIAEGRTIVRDTLGTWGVPPDAIVMNDGSGLSRYDYVTADTVLAVLRHEWQDERLRGPFVASLPVGGRDGTLDTRMKGTILEDRVEGKTGTLANVRSLSGYLETTSGAHVAFSIIANNFTASAGQIDRIVEAALTKVAGQ